jgi:hypothetical protein
MISEVSEKYLGYLKDVKDVWNIKRYPKHVPARYLRYISDKCFLFQGPLDKKKTYEISIYLNYFRGIQVASELSAALLRDPKNTWGIQMFIRYINDLFGIPQWHDNQGTLNTSKISEVSGWLVEIFSKCLKIPRDIWAGYQSFLRNIWDIWKSFKFKRT